MKNKELTPEEFLQSKKDESIVTFLTNPEILITDETNYYSESFMLQFAKEYARIQKSHNQNPDK